MLRYFSPELEWKLLALDERWRDGIRVVFPTSRRNRQVHICRSQQMWKRRCAAQVEALTA